MEDILSSPPVSISRKRPAPDDITPSKKPINLKATQFAMPTPPDTEESSNASPSTSLDAQTHQERSGSPAPSCSTLTSIATTNEPAQTGDTSLNGVSTTSTSGIAPPAKRRKLTPTEKLEKQRLKEEKQREREVNLAKKAEDAAKREEEKQQREVEKARRDREKLAKAEERDAKRREKEYEEQRKNEERLKKERSQMRLGAFFQPKPGATSQGNLEGSGATARRKSLSLEPFDAVADQIRAVTTPSKNLTQQPESERKVSEREVAVKSDYRKTFLPFQLPTNSIMASIVAHDDLDLEQFENDLHDRSLREKFDLGLVDKYSGIKQHFDQSIIRGRHDISIEELAAAINGTAREPIDLTDDSSELSSLQRLQRIRVKQIHFHEDVRPAYRGTYTKIASQRAARKIGRNPFSRSRPDTNYDYDSEAEWEEPEEGDEEILSEADDDSDLGDADDNDGFLDDEDDTARPKRIILGDLVPASTGLCWADSNGKVTVPLETPQDIHDMRMEFLVPGFTGVTIDPFSTEYWQSGEANVTSTTSASAASATSITAAGPLQPLMAPPRPPLVPRLNSNNQLVPMQQDLHGAVVSDQTAAAAPGKRGRKAAPRLLAGEDLAEFKEAVVGSTMGKLELQKGLKTRFPKLTADTIKEMLGTRFAQVGLTKADKKWVFVGEV